MDFFGALYDSPAYERKGYVVDFVKNHKGDYEVSVTQTGGPPLSQEEILAIKHEVISRFYSELDKIKKENKNEHS